MERILCTRECICLPVAIVHGVRSRTTVSIVAVHHFGSHAAMEHQRSHSRLLCSGGTGGVRIEHVCPVVRCAAEVCRLYTIAFRLGAGFAVRVKRLIRVTAHSLHRPLPIVHHLCHSCSHTSGVSLVRSCTRAEIVVGRILIPLGGNQRSDHCVTFSLAHTAAESIPLLGCLLGSDNAFVLNLTYKLVVLAQPTLYIHGHVFGLFLAGLRICQNRSKRVIACDDYPAFSVGVFVDIEHIFLCSSLAHHFLLRCSFSGSRGGSHVHKVVCDECCVIRRDSLCE